MRIRLLVTSLACVSLLGVPSAAVAGGTTPMFASSILLQRATSNQAASAYTPDQLETAYDLTPLLNNGTDGTGQTIALIEIDRFNMSDIQQFDASAGLSDPQIQQYTVNGPFRLGSSGETTMDLEWAHALAPGADLQVYYINNNVSSSRRGWSDLASAVRQAAANGASIISMSFGSCRADTGYTATKNALAAVMKQGVSAFVASGDDGAHPGPVKDCGTKLGVSYPASDPSVAAVGGTSLLLNDDNTIASETAWSRSGGGKGNPLLRPAWQVAASLHPGKYRYAPDVAFLGNPSTGVEVFYKGDWYRAGGTSLGAPGWSAIWALLRQDAQQQGKTVGAAPPLLYRIGNSTAAAQAFHDITTGSNGKYKAGTGWDAVTGWGTPDANGLASTLAG